MVATIGSALALQPSAGGVDSLAESPARRSRNAGNSGFYPDSQTEAGHSAALQKARPGNGVAVMQLLRRRTDRGEPADQSIEIPPHLERRRAWREAFGLNTYHAQQLAQTSDEAEAGAARDARGSALQAYRGLSRRGRLDLDLAQLVSVTV
ncbi:hypothetical protein [Ferrovibrio sp.]|uniref:hypothetical protein n=1 Tax=Ferrovibrio sp. TaxID=1917215 RepID=UPI00260CF447|nr:hypothetical protein [Ferrovibrio sp.]